ncbi:glycosyltransferase [Alisedimentitalea sp. MJ-SS2]|uniref:glycosyltransferase n=1 Tax=Aliisedimentitalea sp. MJ-SS2 TaxID=3049795 RepID=UPI00290A876B|nr:glycosyltransferase [Alisedimentitalea sp. MJ-SS2]MDU8930021.1 glycosyltransferase [Alisedimentitalea sp. MJ-SS2]
MKTAAFIGHSFHAQTRSSDFFQEILASEFELDTFSFDPGHLGEFDYRGLLTGEYDFYFFWQSEVIASHIYNNLKGQVVMIPMYDAAIHHQPEFWRAFPRVKFISFSSQLHTILQNARCNSTLVRYYPEQGQRSWSRKDPVSAFFWERRPGEDYDARAVIDICRSQNIGQLHIHLAADFGTPASERQGELEQLARDGFPQVALSFSEWYPSRADLLAECHRHPIYFAPRATEGIGMSFLEAMAHEQIVIGPDQPTMNEYVADGVTGFLLNSDFSLPEYIDLTPNRLHRMASTVRDHMAQGRQDWLEDVERLKQSLAPGNVPNVSDRGSAFERQVRVNAGARA